MIPFHHQPTCPMITRTHPIAESSLVKCLVARQRQTNVHVYDKVKKTQGLICLICFFSPSNMLFLHRGLYSLTESPTHMWCATCTCMYLVLRFFISSCRLPITVLEEVAFSFKLASACSRACLASWAVALASSSADSVFSNCSLVSFNWC